MPAKTRSAADRIATSLASSTRPSPTKTGRTPNDIHDLMTQWFLPRPRLRKLSNWPDGDVRTIVRDVRTRRG